MKPIINPVEVFRRLPLPKQQPVMTRLRGNPAARCLLIAPVPCENEYARDLPFTNSAAQQFHHILQEMVAINTDEDMLVVPCVLCSLKASKYGSEVVKLFLSKVYPCFRLFVAVGDDAFRLIFGRGLKASMPSLEGQTMYVPETGNRPLFVFPSPAPLVYEETSDRRENWRRKDWADQQKLKFEALASKFGKVFTENKCHVDTEKKSR